MNNIKAIINKTIGYTRSLGLIKGLNYSFMRNKQSKTNKKELKDELPKIENELQDILIKYQNKKEDITSFEKNIFFFWWDNIDDSPILVKKCLDRIKKLYPEYKINIISKSNITNYIEKDSIELTLLNNNKITIQSFSDLLRFHLIKKYGGIWIDSTVFFIKKINFEECISKFNFFTIEDINTKNHLTYKNNHSSWSSFLIGGKKESPLFECLYELFSNYYLNNYKKIYFLVDACVMLCKVYKIQNDVLNKYHLETYDIFYVANNMNSKKTFNFNNLTIQKLNWRINIDKLSSESLINRLFSFKID